MGDKIKHIGIVGGLSPESTAEYLKYFAEHTLSGTELEKTLASIASYLATCKTYNERKGYSNFPDLSLNFPYIRTTLRSLNLQAFFELQSKGRWEEISDVMLKAIFELKDAGADFCAIASNTPHNAYDLFKEKLPIPVLPIMDATAAALQKDGAKRVGLLGTKQTMEYGFFQRVFSDYGIGTLVPDKAGRDCLDKVIWTELVHGKIVETSREDLKRIIHSLTDKGAGGIVLGCTELPLLIKPENVDVKTYDTMTLHAQAILAHSI